MSDELIVEKNGALSVITINRPRARNAIDRATADAIADALIDLDEDPALAVGVITGSDGNFCAGMDLKAFVRGERPNVPGRGFAGIAEARPVKPLIAAVEGYALAGGCEIALASDMIVASTSAKFGLPEVKRGLVALGGGLLRLPQRIPSQIAMELALTGGLLDAPRAHHFGLVNRLTDDNAALAGAVALAEEIAANGPLAVRATKSILSESPGWTPEEAFELQRNVARIAMESDDAQEGARAFAEKRPPQWKGR